MIPPFTYPKSAHVRRLTPGPFTRYQLYKPSLREEFYGHCVYCRTPDPLKGHDAFGVDHYKPKARFPSLATVYSNLFYSCNTCNRRKGSFWPSAGEEKAGVFVPNPCAHVMFRHLRFSGTRVEGRTAAGKFTADTLLHLNDDERLRWRWFAQAGLAKLEKDRQDNRTAVNKIRIMLRTVSGQTATRLQGKLDELTEIETQLTDLLAKVGL